MHSSNQPRPASRGTFLLIAIATITSAFPCPTARAQTTAAPSAASIYGSDDRRFVGDTSVFPYSAIGRVELWYGSTFYVGSGVMIGRQLALTAAHVTDAAASAGSIRFVPGGSSRAEPFGRIGVVKVLPAPWWTAYADDGYDLSILVLDAPIGDQTGYFQIDVQPDASFDGLSLTSAGYPSDLGIDMYTVAGRTYGMDGNVILHDLDSEPGQSGSPMWHGGNDPASTRLVGILEGSYIRFGAGEIGIAARIDRSVADWINQTLAAYDDVSQGTDDPTDPTDPMDPTDASPIYVSPCGFGAVQALFGGSLGLLGMFVARRRR